MGKKQKIYRKNFHSLFGVVFVFAGVLLFGTSAKQPEMSRVIEPHICKTAVRAFRSLPMRI